MTETENQAPEKPQVGRHREAFGVRARRTDREREQIAALLVIAVALTAILGGTLWLIFLNQ